jgi:hypothetical protein
LVLVLCAVSRAHGAPLAIHTTGTLPFSTAELEAALALRAQLATTQSPRRIEAEVSTQGTAVRVAIIGRARTVALEGVQGAEAARLVAFAILDLAGDQLDPPAAAAAPESPTAPASVAVHAIPAVREDDPAWTAGVWGVGGPRDEVTLELGVRLHGPVRAIASAGAGLGITTGSVERRGFPARLGIAWRHGAFEARATAVAVIERASAERTSTDAIVGGGAGVAWIPAHVGAAALLVGAGADAFATAIDYRVAGMPVVTTERFGWWAGLGIAWESR